MSLSTAIDVWMRKICVRDSRSGSRILPYDQDDPGGRGGIERVRRFVAMSTLMFHGVKPVRWLTITSMVLPPRYRRPAHRRSARRRGVHLIEKDEARLLAPRHLEQLTHQSRALARRFCTAPTR